MADLEKIPNQETPLVTPEVATETPEQSGALEVPKTVDTVPETLEAAVPAPAPAPAPDNAPQSSKDETTKSVETVLEEGLGETYKKLPPDAQKKFRAEGEKVTAEIVGMMKKAKVNAQKVLKLIREWLKVIPHVNRYFLDQEAKIKTDRIMHLSEENQDVL